MEPATAEQLENRRKFIAALRQPPEGVKRIGGDLIRGSGTYCAIGLGLHALGWTDEAIKQLSEGIDQPDYSDLFQELIGCTGPVITQLVTMNDRLGEYAPEDYAMTGERSFIWTWDEVADMIERESDNLEASYSEVFNRWKKDGS